MEMRADMTLAFAPDLQYSTGDEALMAMARMILSLQAEVTANIADVCACARENQTKGLLLNLSLLLSGPWARLS